jgi:hypothetical protein
MKDYLLAHSYSAEKLFFNQKFIHSTHTVRQLWHKWIVIFGL